MPEIYDCRSQIPVEQMHLLITDTSGKNGSVAVAHVGENANELQVIESAALAGGTFSAQLVPQIAALLNKHGLTKTEIDAFIVVSGPGSFTGLRVGLAAIKALGEILAKPIVPVSLLEVIASASGAKQTFAALEAGRREAYLGEYDIIDGSTRLIREQLVLREDVLELTRDMPVVTPDLPLLQFARESAVTTWSQVAVTAELIGRLGVRKLHSGETVPPDQLDANYLRRSDADLFSKPVSS
jgi:tRNA threonylcarbamoyladenosine biosynthesis protein TsaB